MQLREHFLTARAGFLLLTFMGVICLIFVFVMGIKLADKVTELRAAPRDNTQFTLFQTNTEFIAMKAAWLAAGGEDRSSAVELRKRFDIFYSRINLLKTSRITSSLRQDPAVASQIDHLSRFLSEKAQIIDAGGHKTPEGWKQLGLAIAEVEPAVNALVKESLEAFAKASDQERAEFEKLLLSLAALLSLMGALLAIALINMQRKADVLRKQSANLEESQQQLKATVASALDAVIIADKDGRIIDWNDEAAVCFGYSRDQVIGRTMSEVIVPEKMRAAHEAGMKRHLETGETKIIGNRVEINALNAEGREFPIELAVGSARTTNGPIFIAFARDISDRKAKQEELRAAAERAKAGEKAKAAFLAVMSHEMRTPLNGVLGTLELMCDTPLDARQRKLVQTANASGELLLDLINNVLDLSKVDADKLELHPEQFDLRSMLKHLSEMLAPSLQDSDNRLTMTVDDNIPAHIETDPGRLRQAIINLLSNANKFTSCGSISLDCQLEKTGDNGDQASIRFSISDTGIGIPRHRIAELFQEFTQIDPSFRRRQGGTGLGLVITKRTVEAMGGEVGVSSLEGHGSTFWFTVPIRLCQIAGQQGRQSAQDVAEAQVTSETASISILLAEDNFTNAMVASDMLESEGHTVVHVSNGCEAVAAARDGSFDLILMDISMPEMDGIEATMIIREHEAGIGRAAVPIFALTANAMPEEVERFHNAGMDNCLTKPIRKQKLVDAINAVQVNRSSQTKEAAKTMTDINAKAPVIDHAVLYELETATNASLVTRVLDKYMEESANRLRAVKTAVEAGDILELQKLAHSLSGSSSTVGATRLQQLVATIEALCIEGNGEKALAMAQELETVGSQTHKAYENLAKERAA